MSDLRKRRGEIVENHGKIKYLKRDDTGWEISTNKSIEKAENRTESEFSSLHHRKPAEQQILLDRHNRTLVSPEGFDLLLDDCLTNTFWILTFRMRYNLYLTVQGHEDIQTQFLFRVTVKVLHPELTATIEKFGVANNGKTNICLAGVKVLQDEGYFGGGRWIKVLVSITPINIIVREEIKDYLRGEYYDDDDWTLDLRMVRMYRFRANFNSLEYFQNTTVFKQEMKDSWGYEWKVKINLKKFSFKRLQLEVVIVQKEGDSKRCYYFIQLANERVILCIKRHFDYEEYRDDDDGYVMRKVFTNDRLFSVDHRDRYSGRFEIDFAISAIDSIF